MAKTGYLSPILLNYDVLKSAVEGMSLSEIDIVISNLKRISETLEQEFENKIAHAKSEVEEIKSLEAQLRDVTQPFDKLERVYARYCEIKHGSRVPLPKYEFIDENGELKRWAGRGMMPLFLKKMARESRLY